MIDGTESQFVTLITNLDLVTEDESHSFNGGEVGRIIRRGHSGDPTLLVKFAGRPALCCIPSENCVIGHQAVA